MAVDTPATIAVLGAGPVGLETALYARFLGYAVDVYERGSVARSVTNWGHVRMFSPFGMNRTTLGLAALKAQDADYNPPADETLLTGREWVDRYLLPLSKTDLLMDGLRENATVISVSKQTLLKSDSPGNASRGDEEFRILLRDEQGRESTAVADVVIDTTGVFDNPNWAGPGGAAAGGENELRAEDEIEYALPDILDADRAVFAGRHTLLIGSGYSAATNLVALSQLADESPGTRVTWITRRAPAENEGPMRLIPDDALPDRDELSRTANSIARDSMVVKHLPATAMDSIRRDDSGEYVVQLTGRHSGELRCDRVIANVGFRPDDSLHAELQVHQCYATEGPMKLAAALLGETTADCLDQTSHGPQSLLNPEPNFYILGAKSYGRNSNFLVSIGFEQIRELFSIIGGRADLDLYAGTTSLPK